MSISNRLSSSDLIRTISSFVKLNIKPKTMILNCCKNLNMYDLDALKTEYIVYFVDSLLKVRLRDRHVAGGLLKALENRYERFEVSQKILMVKGICLIGSVSQVTPIIPTFENDIYQNIDYLNNDQLTFLFELLGNLTY